MKNFRKFFTFCCVILLNNKVSAIGDNYVSKGDFPYMAFIYYPDETVRDAYDNRFFQNAILIKPNWLISAAIEVGNGTFPEKTLIARVGAVTIDANLTFNEDEDEQEGEVIQVVRPINYIKSPVWSVDISLFKTLLPFNITSAVKFVELNVMFKFTQSICKILAFTRHSRTQNKVLSQVTIELLPRTTIECGMNFIEDTMICGLEDKEFTNLTSTYEFCQDNSGGPLICEDEIIGIQTYEKDQACKKPRLYQLISAWRKFILCGTVYSCHDGDDCSNTCQSFLKDQITDEVSTVSTTSVYVEKFTPLIESFEIAPTPSSIAPVAVSITTTATSETTTATSNTTASTTTTAISTSTETSPTTISTREDSSFYTKNDIESTETTRSKPSTTSTVKPSTKSVKASTQSKAATHSKAKVTNVTIETDITDKQVFRGAKIEAQLEDMKARRSSATGVHPVSHIAMYSFLIKYLY